LPNGPFFPWASAPFRGKSLIPPFRFGKHLLKLRPSGPSRGSPVNKPSRRPLNDVMLALRALEIASFAIPLCAPKGGVGDEICSLPGPAQTRVMRARLPPPTPAAKPAGGQCGAIGKWGRRSWRFFFAKEACRRLQEAMKNRNFACLGVSGGPRFPPPPCHGPTLSHFSRRFFQSISTARWMEDAHNFAGRFLPWGSSPPLFPGVPEACGSLKEAALNRLGGSITNQSGHLGRGLLSPVGTIIRGAGPAPSNCSGRNLIDANVISVRKSPRSILGPAASPSPGHGAGGIGA